MKAWIATSIIGSFAFDADGKLIVYKLFPKNPEIIAKRLLNVQNKEIIPEEKWIINKLIQSGYKEIIWDKHVKVKDIRCVYEEDNPAKDKLQGFRKLAIDLHWIGSQVELNEILVKVNIILTKEKLKKPRMDKIIIHAIGMADELDKVLNVFSERLREWYSLYFPEANKLIPSHEKFMEFVATHGKKEDIKKSGKYKQLANMVDKSAGIPFTEDDIKEITSLSRSVLALYNTKKSLVKYIEKTTAETIPNLSSVAGPLLAARLLSMAGGLEKIARLPSSTLQLLGAEKALFRHLRGHGKAPKYGILFCHPYITQVSKELKGKIARIIAAKLSLAAKIDYFSKTDKGKELKKDLDKKIKQIFEVKDRF
jgi:nucleolar protein 56